MRLSLSTAEACERFEPGRAFGGTTVSDGMALPHPSRTNSADYALLVQRAGNARYVLGTHELRITEGDGLLTDSLSGTACCDDGTRCGVIVLPRHLLRPQRAVPQGALVIHLSRSHGLSRLICDYASNIIAGVCGGAFDDQNASGEAAIIRNLCSLLNLTIAARTGAVATAPDGVAAARRDAIDAFLRENYADPTLSSPSIAARFGISARYLDKLFRRDGRSLMATLTQHRLAACCAMLTEAGLPIAEIARRSGFGTLTQFNRRFRAAYGVTPRAWRARRRWTVNALAGSSHA